MGKLHAGRDLTRSKYIIVASTAAVAMVLGAMSVGAKFRQSNPTTPEEAETLSQIYPIPVQNSSSGTVLVTDIARNNKLTQQQTIPLAAHSDWSKEALKTDPVNLQVRVGLTKISVQTNTLGVSVEIPAVVNDTVDTVTGAVDAVIGGNSGAASPDSTTMQPGTSGDQTPPSGGTDDSQEPEEQASVLNVNLNAELVSTP